MPKKERSSTDAGDHSNNHKLGKGLVKQTAIFRLSADLTAVISETEVWKTMVIGLHETLGYDFVALFLVEKPTTKRNLIAYAGFVDPVTPMLPGEGLSEQPILDGKLQYTPDVTQDPRFTYGAGGSEVDVPIWIGDVVEAVLVAESLQKNAFTSNDLEVLTSAAQITGIAVEKARLYEQAQKEIRDRKRIEVEISRQKEYYQALLMNSPVAVVAADLDGLITSWNPAAEKLFGYSFMEVVGKDLNHFVARHDAIWQEAQNYSRQVLNLERVQAVTKRTRKDGSFVDVELLALPIMVGGEKAGFVAIYHDLTEIKLVEKKLLDKNEQMARELAFAGEIQTSFIPRIAPVLPGWEITTSLLPAMETSGDFLDIRILSDGNLGFLVADVVEKGVGAALFMTLSWSLLRIFSDEYPAVPQRVFSEVNNHILDGTSTNQFLTIFYGVLNPGNGRLVYCNAGHPPPIFIKSGNLEGPQWLIRTGMPLAVQAGESWNHGFVQFDPGDLLFLYTDGIIEAQNSTKSFYGINRLERILVRNQGKSIEQLNQSVLKDVERFQRSQAQLDDIAIISIKREADTN